MERLKQRPGMWGGVPRGIFRELLPVILVFAAIHVYAQENNYKLVDKKDFPDLSILQVILKQIRPPSN